MEELKRLLAFESKYEMPDRLMDRFLAPMEEIRLCRGEAFVRSGEVNPDIYVVKDGIIALTYMNGTDYRCWGFGLAGSMIFSAHSYYNDEPSFFQIEACCDTVVLRLRRQLFNDLMAESHEFALWVAGAAHMSLYYHERKNALINGNAAERFEAMQRHRPEIIRNVSNKLVASYLGVTQQYLSSLKRKIFK